MRFKPLHIDSERYFVIGVDEDTGEGVVEIASIGVFGQSLFFRLTADELRSFHADPHSLDDLAERFAQDKGVRFYSDRLLRD